MVEKVSRKVVELVERYDLIVKNCSYLKPDYTIESGKTLGISQGKIIAIMESGVEVTGDTVINGYGKLVIPGLVDGHTHVCQQLLRGRTLDEYPMIWARILVPFESNLEPEDVYFSTLLACLEMIRSGTTAFADAGGRHMNYAAEAAILSGLRANIARSTMDTGAFIPDCMKESIDQNLKETEKLYKGYHNAGDGRIKIWASLRQVMTCTPDLIREIAELARELKTGIHMHLAEHKDEVSFCLQHYQLRPVEFLESLGVLGPNLLTAHNVMLSERELTVLKNYDVKLIHCPRNNFDSHGFPKTPRMLEMGLSIGLGSDGAATSSLSLLDEMKVFRSGIHAYWGLPVFDPVVLPADALLKMATFGGTKAMMLNGAGTIDVGSIADLTILNIDQPHILPTHNLVKTVVEAAGAADVTDVIVGGRVIMKEREVLTIDEEKVMYEAKVRLRAISERAGL